MRNLANTNQFLSCAQLCHFMIGLLAICIRMTGLARKAGKAWLSKYSQAVRRVAIALELG